MGKHELQFECPWDTCANIDLECPDCPQHPNNTGKTIIKVVLGE